MAACVNGNSERLVVKAVYKFKASNNDEVSYKHVDIEMIYWKDYTDHRKVIVTQHNIIKSDQFP